MRRALWGLLLILLLGGCGGTGTDGDLAERTVRGDWNFNSNFPDRPDLVGTSIDEGDIVCPDHAGANRAMRCRVVPTKDGERLPAVTVIAEFGAGDVLTRWDLA